jgi:hypothetical protein
LILILVWNILDNFHESILLIAVSRELIFLSNFSIQFFYPIFCLFLNSSLSYKLQTLHIILMTALDIRFDYLII